MRSGVNLPVSGFSVFLLLFFTWSFIENLGFVSVISGGYHRPISKGNENIVCDGEASSCGCCLCLLQHADVMGDALSLVVEIHHVGLDGNGVGGINVTAIVTDVHHDLDSNGQCVVRGRDFYLT